MKALAVIYVILIFSGSVFSQANLKNNIRPHHQPVSGYITDNGRSVMRGIPDPVKTVIPNSGANVTTPCAPQGSRRFIRACYLITPGEMKNSQFGANIVTSVGWTWIALDLQSIATTGTLRVYLQNTSDTGYSKGTSFSSAISGMTIMIDGVLALPSGEGTYSIDVPSGGPGTLPFTAIADSGIYVAFEYETTGPLALPVGSPTVSCNDSLASSIALNTRGAMHSDTLTISGNRPETRFGDASPDIVEILSIYTMGLLPFPFGFPDTLGINIVNNTPHVINDFRVSSINTQNSSYVFDTIFSASASLTAIELSLPTLWEPQEDIVIVKALPGDVTDFQQQYCHTITPDAYNHADPCLPEDGGLGFTGINGKFVAAFHNYSTQVYPVDVIDHCFVNDSSGGLQQYRLQIYLADPFGKPGAMIYNSPVLVSPPGNNASQSVSHFLPGSAFIPPGAKFFVGYLQLFGNNINACFQYEYPLRPESFYYALTDTGTVWKSFESDSLKYRLDLGPRTCKNLKVKLYLEGFFNGSSMVRDNIILELRDFNAPNALIGTDTSRADSTGCVYFNFPASSPAGNYYYVVKHRNHLETWSHASPEKIDSCNAEYNFTDSATKAYGSNMKFVPALALRGGGGFCIYAGDVDQDGTIDASDASLVDNDVFNFVTGYVSSDVNGDEITDATDALYVDNNAYSFVSVSRP